MNIQQEKAPLIIITAAFCSRRFAFIMAGVSPYPDIALVDLYYKLCDGYRMEQPCNCSDEL